MTIEFLPLTFLHTWLYLLFFLFHYLMHLTFVSGKRNICQCFIFNRTSNKLQTICKFKLWRERICKNSGFFSGEGTFEFSTHQLIITQDKALPEVVEHDNITMSSYIIVSLRYDLRLTGMAQNLRTKKYTNNYKLKLTSDQREPHHRLGVIWYFRKSFSKCLSGSHI